MNAIITNRVKFESFYFITNGTNRNSYEQLELSDNVCALKDRVCILFTFLKAKYLLKLKKNNPKILIT